MHLMEYYSGTEMELTIIISKNIGESQSIYAGWMKPDWKTVYWVWFYVYKVLENTSQSSH